jgi:DNA helicase-2/ATP-dependent DNA helicase PcrA
VLKDGVEPEEITALTFTRAAAAELRSRVDKALEGKVAGRPRITTLHSFALRMLLRNAKLLDALPQPLRIADDWEERHIIQEDLKESLDTKIKVVRQHLLALSADWDTLRADETAPNPLKADPSFVGEWLTHRTIYGYTLRSELVYQLKRALEQRDDLKFDRGLKHLLVDEYQDLNKCDLSVVGQIAKRGALLFGAGDDDQSIYGFRHANPEGIRRFDRDHAPSVDLPLRTCMRCDRKVMDLSRFVADLDTRRLVKPWEPRAAAGPGEVRLLRFDDGDAEAAGIASLCKYLTTEGKLKPDEILILIRSDQNGAFSTPLADHMKLAGVPFNLNVSSSSPLDSAGGRTLLSLLRLAVNELDSLAWRTLLMVRKNRVGAKGISSVAELARQDGVGFASALRARALTENGALHRELVALDRLLAQTQALVGKADDEKSPGEIQAILRAVAALLTTGGNAEVDNAAAHIQEVAIETDVATVSEVLSVLATAGLTPEQETAKDAVNMLTMHKAKGLDAKAVIIMACEDEYLPGRQQSSDSEADERRLLYVSLTRARERLYVTYAQQRTGQQQHTGRDSGKLKRTLTRYLRSAPLHAEAASSFFATLGK